MSSGPRAAGPSFRRVRRHGVGRSGVLDGPPVGGGRPCGWPGDRVADGATVDSMLVSRSRAGGTVVAGVGEPGRHPGSPGMDEPRSGTSASIPRRVQAPRPRVPTTSTSSVRSYRMSLTTTSGRPSSSNQSLVEPDSPGVRRAATPPRPPTITMSSRIDDVGLTTTIVRRLGAKLRSIHVARDVDPAPPALNVAQTRLLKSTT